MRRDKPCSQCRKKMPKHILKDHKCPRCVKAEEERNGRIFVEIVRTLVKPPV